jgi:cobalt-zinc-cadmium efflux system membrane fusion protein
MVTYPARGAISIPGLVAILVLGAWLPLFGCSGEKGNPGVVTGESAHAGAAGQVAGAGQVGGPGHDAATSAGSATPVGEDQTQGGALVDASRPPVSEEVAAAEGAEASDLDESVEALLAKSCEHEIPQYTCDECRYEVGMVKVSPDLFAAGGLLSTARVTARPSGTGRVLNGEVALDADKAVQITPRVPGVVQSMHVDVGSPVARGQVLLVLDSPDISEARSAWRRANAGYRLAEATSAREADLFARRVCPKKDLLEAEAARDQAKAEERAAASRLAGYGLDPASLENDASGDAGEESAIAESRYTIRAPFAGRVLERSVNLGASVEPGQELLLIGDTSRMWIQAQAYERELAVILGAQARGEVPAEVTVPAYPGRTFPGRVDRMSGILDEATRTARIRIIADNPDGLLRAGMFARVNLLVGGGATVLAVPADAVLEDAGRSFVFVPTTPPYFLRRPVRVGRAGQAADGWVEILDGLREGDTVVSRGAFQLKSDVLRSKMGAGCAD